MPPSIPAPALPMGEPLIYNKLLANIMAVDGIRDTALVVGAEYQGKFIGFQSNLATDNRKVLIDNQHIFVGLMDEAVQLTLVVTVEPKAGTSPSSDALQTAVREGSASYQAVNDAILAELARASGVLKIANLQDAIRPLLGNQAVPLQLTAPGGMTLSCRYVESGRLLKNTDELTVAEHDPLPVWRNRHRPADDLRRLALRALAPVPDVEDAVRHVGAAVAEADRVGAAGRDEHRGGGRDRGERHRGAAGR